MPEYADNVIRNHVENYKTTPLFMYLPFQDVHSPLQVPEKYLKLYPNVKNKARKTYSGMYVVVIYIILISFFWCYECPTA